MHEVSTLHCNTMTKSLRCVSSEVRSLPYYDGLTNLDKFMDAFEREDPDKFMEAWWGTIKTVLMNGANIEE